MMTRKNLIQSAVAAFASGFLLRRGLVAAPTGHESHSGAQSRGTTAAKKNAVGTARTPGRVITPNVGSLPYTMDGGVKVFHLIAEPVVREFAPGMLVNCWGYNGQSPGPTIEAFEGDRVRMLVTNKLSEPTSVHWHGVLLPNGMDGVAGLNQPYIQPGETYAYEFTLRQHGTQMYHPHSDEMVQMAMGMMGMFIIHPRRPLTPPPDRDFAIMPHEWYIAPGTATPNPNVMTDFNIFTFNGRVYPGTDALVVRKGDRVRLRFGNLSMDSHPVHLHGYVFQTTGTDGGPVPASARWSDTTVSVPVGATRDIEFVADEPGDWALHCHKSHHTMNAMSHDVPNMIGVTDAEDAESAARKLLPGYMNMGQTGMHEMTEMDMGRPKNTLPMMGGEGPYGPVGMGGMFTVLKVREKLRDLSRDPGWYNPPKGTLARKVEEN